jgi:CheY-like chemotaxis protein
MRVLVVEDDAGVRDTLSDLLAASGHTVTVAGTHAQAVSLLRQPQWDVLLADLVLPGGSGLDLAERAVAQGVAAVLCTGHPNQMQLLRERGIGHLAKPFSLETLEHAITVATAVSQ